MSDQSVPATMRRSLRLFLRRYASLVLISSPAVMVDGHAFAAPPRAVQLSDLEKLRTVSGMRLSPDGTQVVYTVTEKDAGADETRTSIWKVAVNGGAPVRIGIGHMPGWSHDGRRISFLRASERGTQLWLIDDGADSAERRVTDIAGGIDSYAWSPDGTRLALAHTARTEEPRDGKASGAIPLGERS
jgi:dipeptidyl aminopeptidase/acylaminoacyl peptidase